jgi:photosystem II stability/assembly factor-like uncharacterized protein
MVAYTADHGASWEGGSPLPDFLDSQGQYFGYAHLTDLACAEQQTIVGGGYWTGVRSDDGGRTWGGHEIINQGYRAQTAALAISATGTIVAVGYYDFVGRGAVSEWSIRQRPLPIQAKWYNDVATASNGRWWVVGERGTVLHSSDDGVSWTAQGTPKVEDLYAVDFWDEALGMAVGAHGTALLTVDGGRHWQDVSTGLDHYLGDLLWVDDASLLVVGGGGTLLRYQR